MSIAANPAYGSRGRVTLPTEVGAEEATLKLIERLKADAVRNSDGTALPDGLEGKVDKIYATRFVARGDQDWALTHPEHAIRQYLLSRPVTAFGSQVRINPLEGYYERQFELCRFDDPQKYWEVRDRTSGEVVPADNWHLDEDGLVTVEDTEPYHEYTVAFLACQIWDGTQMYNFITNDWDETKVNRERPYDIRYPETWQHVKDELVKWMGQHPEINVVRFTTFFYHFTLVFNDEAKEKYVDWFGYSASVSAPALEEFAAKYGYHLTPEDFVDGGYYNSSFRPPSPRYLDWIEFQTEFVSSRVKELVELVHAAGKEAMMFLGDNWIGTEPYGKYFKNIGLDAVVGSFGSAATTRMISEIPGVKYTEGRMLPYFFPDTFHPGGNPLLEAKKCWATGRRAILRKPLDRIGYGGYVSLALQFPEFIDYTVEIADEFRLLHDRAAGSKPWTAPVKVAVLNCWGALRSWMTEMVAHAIDFKQTRTYQGVIETLAGAPLEVKFISFAEVEAGGVTALADVDVIVLEGAFGTAFSGGPVWQSAQLVGALREFVARGGGLVGVGAVSAWLPQLTGNSGRTFRLADVLGVDQEIGYSLSTDKYVTEESTHFITADWLAASAGCGSEGGTCGCSSDSEEGVLDVGEGARDVYPLPGPGGAKVLKFGGFSGSSVNKGEVHLAANNYGQGRAVYFAGLPYNAENARTFLRALLWAGGIDNTAHLWWSSHVDTDLAIFPETGWGCVVNSSLQPVVTTVTGPGGFTREIELVPVGYTWFQL